MALGTQSQLRFAIGPVQTFVAQSRRTRDLWSSSFLLSYLAGCAIDAIELEGGRVVLPFADGDALREAIRARREGRPVPSPPTIGSLPNQLTIEAAAPGEVAVKAVEAVRRAWKQIASEVWKLVERPAEAAGCESRTIWERQVNHFLQIAWAVGGADALARRKSWRGGYRPPEPGDKCTLMVGWQELSGFHRAKERHQQDAFWKSVREALPRQDLREDERLCSLALVKRLFPAVAQRAIGWDLDTVHWPSTPYLAAHPWVENVLAQGAEKVRQKASAYARAVHAAAGPAQGNEAGSERLRSSASGGDQPFLRLAGNFYFRDDLRLPERTPLVDESARESLSTQLGELSETIRDAGLKSEPSRFYSLLLLDGDRLGKTFGESPNRDTTSAALGRFARQAVDLVTAAGGLTVYAGGDDLLAFLPVPGAFSAAAELAGLYERTLGPVAGSRVTTSAALIFAHSRAPLRSVVEEAHRLLDEEAKEANGRGSIAVAVWKSSGVTLRWVTTWERQATKAGDPAAELLAKMVEQLAQDEVSSSFLFGQRVVLTRLSGADPWQPGLELELPEGIAAEPLVRAELARALDVEPEDVAGVAAQLVELMTPVRRDPLDGSLVREEDRVVVDPLLLARFLSAERPGSLR